MGFELVAAGVGELHHAVANHSRNDAAYGRERKEERFRFASPSHDPFPRHHRPLFPYSSLFTLHPCLLGFKVELGYVWISFFFNFLKATLKLSYVWTSFFFLLKCYFLS